MAEQVISLSSSDEEESSEPPPKKFKQTLHLPECTLTPVPSKACNNSTKVMETVSLDSDEEVCTEARETVKEITKDTDKVIISKSSETSVNLINLVDDDDVTQSDVVGSISSVTNCERETVSIEDSDVENNSVETNDKTHNKKADSKVDEIQSSIVIDDSDEETEKENHCEIESNKTFPAVVEQEKVEHDASSSKDELAESKNLFEEFLKMIEEKIVDSPFEEGLPKKVPIMKKYFNKSGSYIKDQVFNILLSDCIEEMKKSTTSTAANTAVLTFHKVFEHLKSHMAETEIIIEKDHLPKVKRLEQTIALLRERIRQLEVAEVNFDDDADSTYIMLDRYQARLNKVYALYCQYIKRNPHSGRAIYDRITFVNSSYNEINQALTKKYKNSLIFPSYYELESFIRKIVQREKLDLGETEIKIESEKCFKVLGNILQKKRRQELYDSHLDFVESSEDPATKDVSLENILKKNYAEGKEKIEKLYQKFVEKQEKGEDTFSTEEEECSEDTEKESDNEEIGMKKIEKAERTKLKKMNGDKEKQKHNPKSEATTQSNPEKSLPESIGEKGHVQNVSPDETNNSIDNNDNEFPNSKLIGTESQDIIEKSENMEQITT